MAPTPSPLSRQTRRRRLARTQMAGRDVISTTPYLSAAGLALALLAGGFGSSNHTQPPSHELVECYILGLNYIAAFNVSCHPTRSTSHKTCVALSVLAAERAAPCAQFR